MIFSIIVPIYNSEKYLRDCLNSIINQTYIHDDNIETILINDGSADNSRKIIEEYALKIKNVKIIDRENKGILYTRLEGIKNANGKYILFLDSDDFLPSNCLEIFYNEINKNDYDIVRGNYFLIKKNNEKMLINNFNNNYEISDSKDLYRNILLSDKFSSVWGEVIKKSIIDTSIIDTLARDNSISMGEDIEINQNIYKKVSKMKIINSGVYCYRMNPNGTTHTYTEEKLKKNIIELENVFSQIIENVKEYNDYELNRLAYNRYLYKLNGANYYLVKYIKNKQEIDKYIDITFNNDYTKKAREILKPNEIMPKNRRIFIYLILRNKKSTYINFLKILSWFR